MKKVEKEFECIAKFINESRNAAIGFMTHARRLNSRISLIGFGLMNLCSQRLHKLRTMQLCNCQLHKLAITGT